jgi:hypothetical protein
LFRGQKDEEEASKRLKGESSEDEEKEGSEGP